MPITGTLDSLASLIPQEDAGENMVEKEAEIDASNLKLDELELVDYLKTQGQWTTDIVSKAKPKLDEILNPPAEVDAKGKAKAPAKGAPAEVTFDETELEVSDAPDNNFLLGDAIEQIIKINFAERARLKHPQNPNWLSVKICLAGYPFSGKKEQAERISKQYNLDIFVMEMLVQEAIDFSVANPNEIEGPKPKEVKVEEVEEEKKEEEEEQKSASNHEEGGEAAAAAEGSNKDEAEKEENAAEEVKSAVASQKEEKGEEKKEADGDETLSDICMSEDEDQEFNLQEEFR